MEATSKAVDGIRNLILSEEVAKLEAAIAQVHISRFRLLEMLEARTGLKFEATWFVDGDRMEVNIALPIDPQVDEAMDDEVARHPSWKEYLAELFV